MSRIGQTFAVLTLLISASLSQAGIIVADLEDVTNGGGFFGRVTIEDTAANQVRITGDISSSINSGITQGDILGLWFDFATLTPSAVSVSGATIIDWELDINAVGSSLGGNVNINGSGATGWDLGITVGENGSAGGFNQTLSFLLGATGLNSAEFDNQRIGMRVQSISGVSGFGGSSKLLGEGAASVPEPGTLTLLGASLLGLGLMRRKRQQA